MACRAPWTDCASRWRIHFPKSKFQLEITERSLHRLFQKQTVQARLLRALEQLAHGAKVIDVAMFKKHFGTTPTDFYRTAPTVVKKNAAMHQ